MKNGWIFIIAFVALGIAAGTLSGLLGIGSGVIMVPVLGAIWAKHADAQKLAQGTALAIMVPMTVAGALSYHFGGQAHNFRLSLPLALWALFIGALALAVPLRCSSLLCVTHTLGLVRWHYVVLIALGAVIGSIWVGAPLAAALPTPLLKKIFGFFVIIVGLRMIGVWAMIGHLFAARPPA